MVYTENLFREALQDFRSVWRSNISGLNQLFLKIIDVCLQIDTKYLAPLFVAYDDRLQEKDENLTELRVSYEDGCKV